MSESTQAQLDALKAALLSQGVVTVCSKATDSKGRPLMEMNLKTGEFKLASVESSAPEANELCIDPGQSVPPLRMGKVTFYGETARQIREAQEILRAAGAGQLEVVKRANERDEPYVVVDGQMFINKEAVDEVMIDPVRVEIKGPERLEVEEVLSMLKTQLLDGKQVVAGFEMAKRTGVLDQPSGEISKGERAFESANGNLRINFSTGEIWLRP